MSAKHAAISRSLDRMLAHANATAKDPRHAGRKDGFSALGDKIGEAKAKWDKLGGVGATSDDKDYYKYLEKMFKGLPDIENGVIDAVRAFQGATRSTRPSRS